MAYGGGARHIQKHVDNMWVVGGEKSAISIKHLPYERWQWRDFSLIWSRDGGSLLYHSDSEGQQRSFESACRRFRRFFSPLAR
jgi:hypothetical protein